ncbi:MULTISPECIES: cytochrome o ubiquinol oxidase subunit IV [Gluconobacter]|uniref:Cytochrome bo(3) ubiquinol oxidase subunit 4 n=2 Tax=Gluconobacter TaxID=441 RepID=A0AA37SHD2_9PROT|nr:MULTISPECIES: cytochrome o ubiquinol oxidase subunit IV [Gluconobacter]MBF0860703.1 cytochrome o ubiquinol oxidase subunit IV [Gluconobacter kanchanaburiensis]MBF0884384.1 cytochrome o ubiquinol oxidase subunit IV [Gluconobacter sphaericus]MBS1085283.1 cytochrome o ubiquinol oxidase subunit IV [Gluconobacter sphaericus]MBS1098050.1 cytochrome o ubiquinol oxidase subunit IV [Gluconobacter sphaericus]MBS1098931.1 cytochrome o ubiquinol oxidase subunit IV [Gluconobacter sphaericus]
MAQAHTAHDGSHGSYSAYLIGFVLAVILTVASFAAVMTHALSPGMALAALTVLAVVQIVVHLVFFLHMNTSSEQSWNLMCFIFAAASVIVIIGGTIFIMHDTAINMMSR